MGNWDLPYALPRIVTTQIQCSFGTYFWEMYTQEFGWTAAEYGKVQSLFNFTQCIFFIVFGIIFNCNDRGEVDSTKRKATIGWVYILEIIAMAIHTGFINLIARGRTTDRKYMTPYEKQKLIKPKPAVPDTIASTFPATLLNHRPKRVYVDAVDRFMGTRAYTVYKLVVIHGIAMAAFELCNKAIPVIVYPKAVEVVYTYSSDQTLTLASGDTADQNKIYKIVFSGGVQVTGGVEGKTLNTEDTKEQATIANITVGETASGQGSVAPTVDNNNKTITYTKSGSSTSSLTIATPTSKALKATYSKESDLVTAGQSFDFNNDARGFLITINILTFCIANLVVIWLFSFVKYFIHGIARLAQAFLITSIIFLGGQIPLLIGFYYTKPNAIDIETNNREYKLDTTGATQNSGSLKYRKATAKVTVNRRPTQNIVDGEIDTICAIADLKMLVQLSCLTIFHGTVFFWIFTGGPLTFYVSTNILGGHEGIKAFGVPAILIGFAGATVIFALLSSLTGAASTLAPYLFAPRFKKSVFFICIATQFFTLWVFKPFCNDCGEPQYWKTFLVLIATGATNTMFVTYIYIVLDDVLKTYLLNWVCYGLFFAITNFIISKAMGVMFGAFAGEGTTGFKISSINAVIGHNFPCVYKSITIFFWLANGLALLPIFSNSLS